MTQHSGQVGDKEGPEATGNNQQDRNLREPYREEADANPERRDNGCQIYRTGS